MLFLRLTIANNAVMNVPVHASVWIPVFNSLGYIPRSGIAGSCGDSMFRFLKNHQTVFQGGLRFRGLRRSFRGPSLQVPGCC